DIITVCNALSANAEMIEYITNLAAMVPTTANVNHYANIVKAKSIRRQYIQAAKDIIDLSYDGNYDNLTDYRNDILAKVDIPINDEKRETSSISDIALETLQDIENTKNRSDAERKYYGIKWLDEKTGGAHDGELTILAARPSVGKTAFALQVAINMAFRNNKVAIFSLEMNRRILMKRLIANLSGVDLQKINYAKDLDEIDFKAMTEAAAELAQLPIRIYDKCFRVEEIRGICRELKNAEGIDYVIVDYLQLCETLKRTANKNDLVSSMSRTFKLMTLEFDIPIMVLSQLNRENERDNKKPKLVNLRDSGSIEQDADNVFFLHDEQAGQYSETDIDLPKRIELIIAKQRNGERNKSHDIAFLLKRQMFKEWAKE
ncbi:MAG TPA: DnaB-like helicase C-terminal domain-containing protein, partial [Thermoclostridium sp.]|nr:DnaB-like helicase C-terminal domain-containing protein [Thermoclostridium sp.]